MECRCNEVSELYGQEAGEYVTTHLHPDEDGVVFVCPDTGRRWHVDDHNPEQTRLVRD